MRLSLIITHYKEPWSIMRPMIDSLYAQRGIDWKDIEILLIQDGEEGKIERHHYASYGLPILTTTIEHGGVSKARNMGLLAADGDYVMFCDCDDMFCNAFALNMIFNSMKDGPDIITSAFIEESAENGYHLFRHEKDTQFVHGKVFDRNFLIENNITFPEHIHKHEDGATIRLAFLLTDDVQYITTPFYTWAWNPNSTMREERLIDSYAELMAARAEFLNRLKVRGMDDEYKQQCAVTVFVCYYDFNKPDFCATENQDKVHEAALCFKMLYKDIKDVYLSNGEVELARIAQKCRTEACEFGLLMEHMSLGQFLGAIEGM